MTPVKKINKVPVDDHREMETNKSLGKGYKIIILN